MEYKVQFMSELDVFSEGMRFMEMMHLSRRSHQAKPVTVGQNGAACASHVVPPERKRMPTLRRERRR